MKRSVLITLILLGLTLSITAQQRGNRGGQRGGGAPDITIKGKVLQEGSEDALEYATVSIFSGRDSSLVAGGITEMDGSFEVKAKPGPLYGVIEFIGFEPLRIDPIPFDRDKMKAGDRAINLGTLRVYPIGLALDEIEIRAEKSETQFSLDKKIFNVGKDLANQGGTAEDILDNVPSVTVDVEGEVSLRGSTGVRILVDGRPSGLVNAGNSNGLRSIPSNLIDKIEVITNPSAKYEAEGMAGIINIVLKKEKGSGFNGSFDVNTGIPARAGVGANLNYRKGKLNWFASYGYGWRTGPGINERYTERTRGDSLFITDQKQTMDRNSRSNSFRGGIDYSIGKDQTLTGTLSYRKSDETNDNRIVYDDYVQDISRLVSQTIRTDDESEDETSLEYKLDYIYQIGGNRNHELRASLQYENRSEKESSFFREFLDPQEGASFERLNQRSNNDEGWDQMVFQVDYKKPFSEDSQMEMGIRTSLRGINNDFRVEELLNDNWQNVGGLSNNFLYNEDIHAAYTTYGNKHGKFSYQLGMRLEYSDVVTELRQTNEINDRDYFNFFPSLHLNYELGNNNAMQVSYSRRVNRPRFWYLNPFFTFSDNRNFFGGNPNLDPEFTDSYEIGHIKYWDSGSLSSALFYRHTEGEIQRLLTLKDDGTTLTLPQNISTGDDIGLDISASYSGIDWFRLDGNANFFRAQSRGQFGDINFDVDNFTWFGRATARFTFWTNSDLQLRFNYRGARQTAQGTREGAGSVDVGWNKDVTKDLTLTLSGRDIFNSRKRIYETFAEDFYQRGVHQWRARSIVLSANYRLNQKKKRGRPSGGERGGGGEGEF